MGISMREIWDLLPIARANGSATPVMYTMGTAAKAVGKAKSTISKDVKRGKISATRNPDGSVSIDPAELFRVYPLVLEQAPGARTDHSNEWQPAKTGSSTGFDREQLLKRIAEQAETIRDLRAGLDLEVAERRELSAQVRGLLSNFGGSTIPNPAPAPDSVEPPLPNSGNSIAPTGFPPREPGSVEETEPPGEPNISEVADTKVSAPRAAVVAALAQPAKLAKSSLISAPSDEPTKGAETSPFTVPRPAWWRRWFR
jgi:hypothetical protein